jgi:hypothetical protein
MVPTNCSLAPAEQAEQLERYRRIGAGAAITRTERRVVVDPAPDALVAEAIAVEQRCCPFFQFTREGRALEICVEEGREADLTLIYDALTSGRERARG